jgi:hypothetical protein
VGSNSIVRTFRVNLIALLSRETCHGLRSNIRNSYTPSIKNPPLTSFSKSAVYFDHKRRTDPNFRKSLKKEAKRQARAAKEEAEAHTVRQRQAIRTAVAEAKEEGFPSDVEEKEAYFMQEVARGEGLSSEGAWYPLTCR